MTPGSLHRLADTADFVLGSASPRRRKLLSEMGIRFRNLIPRVDETRQPGEPCYQYAQRMAEQKALNVSRQAGSDAIVLGCDTVVVMKDQVLHKPQNEREAFETLMTLSGKEHVVCTALALVSGGSVLASGYELTQVFFNVASDRQIREYIATGEPMDKAGAYGIQGMGAFLVDRIEGRLDNVIGFPRTLLERLADEALARL